MENQSRDLKQDSQAKNRGRTHELPGRWTVLLIGDLGKIVSFQIGKSLLVASMASIAVILTVVICSVVSYNSLRLENKELRNNLDNLRAKPETAVNVEEKALVGLVAQKASAKDTQKKAGTASDRKAKDVVSKIKKPKPAVTQTSKEKPPEKPKPVAEQTVRKEESETPSPAEEAPQPVQAENGTVAQTASSPANVVVTNLEIWKKADGNSFEFKFSLKKVQGESGKIAGYTFVVLKPEEGSRGATIRAFPWSPLKDGMPAIFKRGQYFSISRFKYVSGKFVDVITMEHFKTATVYVYSDTGDLLLERVFEVGKIFQS